MALERFARFLLFERDNFIKVNGKHSGQQFLLSTAGKNIFPSTWLRTLFFCVCFREKFRVPMHNLSLYNFQ